MNAPALLEVSEGESLAFSHRQAIAASSVLRLMAADLGSVVVSILGERGFVYLAARRAFLDGQPLALFSKEKTMEVVFNSMMSTRYRVRSYDAIRALRVLRDLGLKKTCAERFVAIRNVASKRAS